MAKDYRTWWRKGYEVLFGIRGSIFIDSLGMDVHIFELNEITYRKEDDDLGDNSDCIWEQLWAIREGLSDNPSREGKG